MSVINYNADHLDQYFQSHSHNLYHFWPIIT